MTKRGWNGVQAGPLPHLSHPDPMSTELFIPLLPRWVFLRRAIRGDTNPIQVVDFQSWDATMTRRISWSTKIGWIIMFTTSKQPTAIPNPGFKFIKGRGLRERQLGLLFETKIWYHVSQNIHISFDLILKVSLLQKFPYIWGISQKGYCIVVGSLSPLLVMCLSYCW